MMDQDLSELGFIRRERPRTMSEEGSEGEEVMIGQRVVEER